MREVNFHRLCEGGGQPDRGNLLMRTRICLRIRAILPLPIAIGIKGGSAKNFSAVRSTGYFNNYFKNRGFNFLRRTEKRMAIS